ncbi:type II secretion system protein GspM [Diaphorobacter aerolatus]|uniref:Type II secretion system protein M n=1 Tax=Diaphorobacter aerolatus TaxID=1288495 RepID=A0A7H0GNU6_9BURK|nr:type II secretion system protein GspM [Diaphorobacter aerolatus]QNP49962.1 type II secretion system protein M [Diaphorobacter aerolatus]
MNQLSRRDWILMALTVVVCLIPLFALGIFVSNKYAEGEDQINRLEPRFARLLGLQASAGKMDEKAKLLGDRMSLFIYPSEMDATQAGNDAQQRVRSVLSTAGLTVVSSQVLPTKTEQGFERISLSVRAEGELIHLQAALAVLPSLTPVILVDGINIQVVGLQRADKPQRLGADLKLSVLHRKPA